MEYEPEGTSESLIDAAQEKTAARTRMLLNVSRLVFAFGHGSLVIAVSVTLGFEVNTSWWVVFTPLWLGDALCMILVVWSWFASCPYIHLCLSERQARVGDYNPSILTDLLPDIVIGVLSLLFTFLVLIAEIMLSWYLESSKLGTAPSIWPCATVCFIVSLITLCRGICINSNTELFTCIGGAAIFSCIASVSVQGGPLGHHGWVLLLPWLVSVAGLIFAAVSRSNRAKDVLCKEEFYLRVGEELILCTVFVALLIIVILLATTKGKISFTRSAVAGIAGIVAGAGICFEALLRAKLVFIEAKIGSIRDRLLISNLREMEGSRTSTLCTSVREVEVSSPHFGPI